VQVSAVRIEGLHTTRRDVAERALGRLSGLPYNPATARAAAARLGQLGVFSRAEFTGLEGGPQWQAGTLAFKVEEPHYNRFEGAVGVQGQAGVVGLATLELGNLLGTARTAALGWQSRGAGRSDFSVRYVEPFLAGLPFRLEGALVQQLQDSTYTRTRWGLRLGHALGTGDRIEAGVEEERVVQTRGVASTADLQNTVFAYERDGRDDNVSPRRGTRLRLTGTGVFKSEVLRAPLAGEPPAHRSRAGIVDARAEWHRPTGAATGMALELWGAGRFSSDPVLADYERTPVGGATTLRGHDEEEFRADRVALSRFEYRWFPGGVGEQVSLFWDHAHLFTREAVLDSLGATIGAHGVNRDADGVGLGLRLRTAGGLVDLDYGLAPGRGFLDGRIHLRLVSTF
jgi:outer membrane protein assembly factor BamA